MNSRQRYAKMAKSVRYHAHRYFNSNMKYCDVNDREDRDQVKMFREDLSDLLNVARWIGKGQIKKAALLLDVMDTDPREVVPNYIYDYVCEDYFT